MNYYYVFFSICLLLHFSCNLECDYFEQIKVKNTKSKVKFCKRFPAKGLLKVNNALCSHTTFDVKTDAPAVFWLKHTNLDQQLADLMVLNTPFVSSGIVKRL